MYTGFQMFIVLAELAKRAAAALASVFGIGLIIGLCVRWRRS